jgi:hypothetical protein
MMISKLHTWKTSVDLGLSVSIRSKTLVELGYLAPASKAEGLSIDLLATDMGDGNFHAEALTEDGMAFLDLVG